MTKHLMLAAIGSIVLWNWAACATWKVDPNGTGDFNDIKSAVQAAASGDRILLAKGTFTGSANCEIDLGSKQLIIAGQRGSDANIPLSIIDCGSNGFAFRSSSSKRVTFTGLIIQNTTGPAIIASGSVKVASIVFIDCNEGVRLAPDSNAAICKSKFRNCGDAINIGSDCTALVRECDINDSDNHGIICDSGAKVFISTCTINACRIGVLCRNDSVVIISDCKFDNNLQYAIRNDSSNTLIRKTSILRTLFGQGAAVLADSSYLIMTNVIVIGNSGAGIRTVGGLHGFWNCTIADNLRAGVDANDATPWMQNMIIWGNLRSVTTGPNTVDSNDSVTITFSDVQGGFDGTGNIDTDPLFANPGTWSTDGNIIIRPVGDINDTNIPDNNVPDTNIPDTNIPDNNVPDTNVPDTNVPDSNDVPTGATFTGTVNGYRLKSTAGRWDGNDFVIDSVDSPCIDAADPRDRFNFEPEPNGNRRNMGFDGNTKFASKSGGNEPNDVNLPARLYREPKFPSIEAMYRK